MSPCTERVESNATEPSTRRALPSFAKLRVEQELPSRTSPVTESLTSDPKRAVPSTEIPDPHMNAFATVKPPPTVTSPSVNVDPVDSVSPHTVDPLTPSEANSACEAVSPSYTLKSDPKIVDWLTLREPPTTAFIPISMSSIADTLPHSVVAPSTDKLLAV